MYGNCPNGIALFGIVLAGFVIWQSSRVLRHGGSFYDGEVYGMTPCTHRRIRIAAVIAVCVCLGSAALTVFPITPFVALETLAVILYLSSFARGASEEE
jgi:hypothetical protein